MMKRLYGLLLCLSTLAAPLRADLMPVGMPIVYAAQDRLGTVWAVGGNQGEEKIYRRRGKAWQEEAVPETAAFQPCSPDRRGRPTSHSHGG